MSAYINHVACAVPPYERQGAFLESLPRWVGPPEVAEKLRQIVAGAQARQAELRARLEKLQQNQ